MASDTPFSIGDYLGILRRRWIYVVTVMPPAVLIAVYIAFTIPPAYRSTSTVLLEASSIPEGLVRTTVTAYADQQLELVSRRVLDTSNLVGLAEEIDPYPDQPELDAIAKASLISQNASTERVDPVTFEPLPESNAFSIHYLNEDPDIARAVTGRLAQMFLDYTHETRTQQATDTHAFLQEQSRDARERIQELETELAEFKTRYGDAIPETQSRNQQALDRAERELDTLEQQILLANDRKRTLELQLSTINPNLFDPDGEWRAELTALRTELAIAQQRYTPDHPDVRRLRRAIESLSVRVEQSQFGAPPVPDNPEYIQLASLLATANGELAARETSAARAREQIAAYEHSLRIAPEVEREYARLLRDYEIAKERVSGISQRLAEAALGQVLESEARGDRLSIIRGPSRPGSPFSPNRLGIILMGMVLGAGLAGGLAAIRESADPTIRSARDLSEITDIKPLAAVPFMLNGADRRKRVLAWGIASVIAAVALTFVGTAISQAAS
jgi:polysaccharide chain length determinant protein (PEP-CTERM system associated)